MCFCFILPPKPNNKHCIHRRLTSKMSKKVQDGVKCAIDHIVEAQENGEITEDNVLFIVENINVAGNHVFIDERLDIHVF